MRNIGFVGMGNMARALAEGFIGSKKIEPSMIRAYAPHQDKLMKNCGDLGIVAVDNVKTLVQDSDMIIVLDNGTVSAAGTHDELLSHGGYYARLFSEQKKLYEEG